MTCDNDIIIYMNRYPLTLQWRWKWTIKKFVLGSSSFILLLFLFYFFLMFVNTKSLNITWFIVRSICIIKCIWSSVTSNVCIHSCNYAADIVHNQSDSTWFVLHNVIQLSTNIKNHMNFAVTVSEYLTIIE